MSIEPCLLSELERAAEEFGVSVTTLGRIAGQGGHFYSRIKSGKRCWPETEKRVRLAIEAERLRRALSAQPPEDAA